MKYQVVYGKFVRHRVSCNSGAELRYIKQQLNLRSIPYEVIEVARLTAREKATLTKSEFSFQRFKKEILK